MLGGPDGRTLFMLAAEWRGADDVDGALAARTGQVLAVPALRRMPGGREERRSGAGDRCCGVPNNSAERGVHVLRLVPGEWPLFAATR
jgi:hypothetical protein